METVETVRAAETDRTACGCQTPPAKQVVSVPDLATTFGQSKEYFYEGLREGRFPGVKFGRGWAVPHAFVRAFITDVVETGLPMSFEEFAAQWIARARQGTATTSTAYRVQAKRWGLGYELHIPGIGVTQVADLAFAEEAARDFIALELDVPTNSFDLAITEVAA